jgi:uncharacterized phage protein gp47/JayE
MPIDQLPGEMVVPTRDELIEKYKVDFRFRAPAGTLTGPGTQPDIDAKVEADAVLPIYARSKTIGQGIVYSEAQGAALDTHAESRGLTRREATGASGFVTVTASAGGGTIFTGDEIRDPDTGLRYQCLATAVYFDQDEVPIGGIDTGAGTNAAAGKVLTWTSPRPGIGPNATVAADANGEGLTGGRPKESDQELVARIRDRNANPPASGNDAAYQDAIEAMPTIAVQKGFTVPAIKGPGTIGVTFTLRPATPGASRIPNNAQLAAMEAHLKALFPADDGILMSSLVGVDVDPAMKVSWRTGVSGWRDAIEWPRYYAADGIIVQAATTPTSFTLRTASGSYGAVAQPQAGQTIAFYDAAAGAFRRKRIASFAGAGPWVITVDATLGASDEGYLPQVGQRAMPWSDSLDELVAPVVAYFETLGPGEQLASFQDVGLRQRRSPPSPEEWPSVIGTRLLVAVLDADPVQDATLQAPTVPYQTPVGTPGVLSRLLQLRWLSFFPL